MRKLSNKRIYIILTELLVFGIFQSVAGRIYGFSLYPDEFGYWASAAKVVGYDWSKIASLGSYYSYGYSLILIPILYVFKGGVAAYRAAVAVNYLMIGAGFILLLKLSDRLYADKVNEVTDVMMCAIAVLYPPWVFYSQMTMAESELIFLFILLCYLVATFLHKPGAISLILVIIVSAYMYTVHMRSVGVAVAVLVTYMLVGMTDDRMRRYVLAFIIAAVTAVIIVLIVKRQVVADIFSYADADELAVNSYESQGWKLRHILTAEGMKDFVIETAGKLYYLVISSYGIVVFTAASGIRGVVNIIRGRRKDDDLGRGIEAKDIFLVFLLLSIAAEVLISSIYMHGSDRADSLFYGRYDEFVLPVAVFTGLHEIYECMHDGRQKRVYAGFITAIAYVALTTPLYVRYLNSKSYYRLRGFFVSGIGYLNDTGEYDVPLYMWNVTGLGIIMIALVFTILWLACKVEGGTFLMGLMILLQIALCYRLGDQWTFRINRYVHSNDRLVKIFEGEEDRKLYYLDIDDNYYVDHIQFSLPERDIEVVTIETLSDIDMSNGYLIVNWSYPDIQSLVDRYDDFYESEMFNVFYDN